MLGLLQVQDPSEIKRLLGLYLKYSKLDGKPEKGERKMADDFVLLINEALEDLNDEADRKKGQISEQDLFRIGLLEYALSLSPDNFDIQMSLLKIYDSLGISLLFKQAHESLNMKGVQLESLGYLNLRHSLEWGQYDSIFKPINTKYQKYWMLNENDLKRLKHESFKEENYDQIENLNEYEAFLKASYFNRLVNHVNRITD